MIAYLARLDSARVILWCYAIWYAVNVIAHFELRPSLWLTSLGLSAIIGFALLLSTRSSGGLAARRDPWVLFRLFLMPFCVSSFAALVKDKGYFLVFPPALKLNLTGLAAIAAFLAAVRLVKRRACSSAACSS